MVYPYLYDRKGKGIDLTFGARIQGYWRTSITYGYEYVDIAPSSETYSDDASYYNPYSYYGGYPYYGGYGKYTISSIYPTLYRNTVDSPLTPSRGSLYLIGFKFSGGFLGGDIDLIKPRLELSRFIPTFMRQSIGMHLELQYVYPMNNSSVPFWERFYLGGERSIRGYDIYSVGPRTVTGQNIGGEKSVVFNLEYIIPVGGPLYTIFFFDAGNAYARNQNFSFDNVYTSAGLEARIFVPALRVPFRLIFAYNNRLTPQNRNHFNFRFAIGTTF